MFFLCCFFENFLVYNSNCFLFFIVYISKSVKNRIITSTQAETTALKKLLFRNGGQMIVPYGWVGIFSLQLKLAELETL